MIDYIPWAVSFTSGVLILVGIFGGSFFLYHFVKGYYEAALAGLCCWMAALLEINGLLSCSFSMSQLIASDLVDIGLVLSACTFLHHLRKQEGGRGA